MITSCDYLVIGSGSMANRHVENLKRIFIDKVIGQVSGTERKINKDKYIADILYETINDAIKIKPRFAIIASPASYHLENAKECLDLAINSFVTPLIADETTITL